MNVKPERRRQCHLYGRDSINSAWHNQLSKIAIKKELPGGVLEGWKTDRRCNQHTLAKTGHCIMKDAPRMLWEGKGREITSLNSHCSDGWPSQVGDLISVRSHIQIQWPTYRKMSPSSSWKYTKKTQWAFVKVIGMCPFHKLCTTLHPYLWPSLHWVTHLVF